MGSRMTDETNTPLGRKNSTTDLSARFVFSRKNLVTKTVDSVRQRAILRLSADCKEELEDEESGWPGETQGLN